MRMISGGLQKDFTIEFAAGFSAEKEIDLALDSDEAVIVRDLTLTFDAGSAAPTITAAGLWEMSVALVGESQATPTNILELKNIVAFHGRTSSVTGAAGVEFFPVSTYLTLYEKLVRGLFVHTHAINTTNAATTILRAMIKYDRFTITSAEKMLLL